MKFQQFKRREMIALLAGAAVWRREFIKFMGATASLPFSARAQEPGRVYRIAFLLLTSRESPSVVALLDELRFNGFVEGQNLIVIPGGFGVQNDQIASVAQSVVAASPDVIRAGPELPLRALQKITQTIPLVGMSEDMVATGLAASLARPGGNITGLSLLSPELDGKRQEILMEACPGLRKLAILADSNVTPPAHVEQLRQAAQSHGTEALVRGVAKREEVISVIEEVKASGAQAINFLATPMFSVDPADFIAQLTKLRLASIYQWPEDADGGALLGYGPRFTEMYRQTARIVVKVLRGTKPAEIPVEQPTTFELVINLKTAKAIGVDVPTSLLLRADKIIE
jgi:putative ABC transport system substrate-binding protein